MKRPLVKDFTKPFLLDEKLVTFDSRAYSKADKAYIEFLEQPNKTIVQRILDDLTAINDGVLVKKENIYQWIETYL